MSDLTHTLVVCGLLSGTQPMTLMGLLLVLGGATPRSNGLSFLAGAFLVQAGLLIGASALFGGSVSSGSDTGRSFIGIRIGIGLLLFAFGLLLRRPPGKPIPEIPHALERLKGMGPKQSFVAGIVVADYQGPIIASFALTSSSVAFRNSARASRTAASFRRGSRTGSSRRACRSAWRTHSATVIR